MLSKLRYTSNLRLLTRTFNLHKTQSLFKQQRLFSNYDQYLEYDYTQSFNVLEIDDELQIGNYVEKDSWKGLVVLETDKITVDIFAEKSGFITRINEDLKTSLKTDESLMDLPNTEGYPHVGFKTFLWTISDEPPDLNITDNFVPEHYHEYMYKLINGLKLSFDDLHIFKYIAFNKANEIEGLTEEQVKWNLLNAFCKVGYMREAKEIAEEIKIPKNGEITQDELHFIRGNIELVYNNNMYDNHTTLSNSILEKSLEHYNKINDPVLKNFALAIINQINGKRDLAENHYKLALENCKDISVYHRITHHRKFLKNDIKWSGTRDSFRTCFTPFITKLYVRQGDDKNPKSIFSCGKSSSKIKSTEPVIINSANLDIDDKRFQQGYNTNYTRSDRQLNKISFDNLCELIHSNENKEDIVFFTGSGISVAPPSNLPTRQQLWDKFTKWNAVSIYGLRENPEYIWKVLQDMYSIPIQQGYDKVEPNQAHIGIAKLLKLFGNGNKFSENIITQNVDGLHQLASNLPDISCYHTPIELHGTLNKLINPKTGEIMDRDLNSPTSYDICKNIYGDGDLIVNDCKNMIPDVVLFGESIRSEDYKNALNLLHKANMIISSGTAFDVAPASTMLFTVDETTPIIDINPNKPQFQHQIDYWYEGKAEEVFPKLFDALHHI